MFILLCILFLLVGAALGAASADNVNRSAVQGLDLRRYMGCWYEIARFNHSFERNLVDVQAHYRMLDNGRVEVVNSGRDMRSDRYKKARGKAYASSVAGRLRVSFFWFFYSDYNVMELDDNYEWALVGSSSSHYLWILSRTPRLPVETLNHILDLARHRGYNTERLLFVDQPSDAIE